jgi:hypothetical protein
METINTHTQAQNVKQAQAEKVTYLKEGLTGKQVQNEKVSASRSNKAELKTFSFQQGQFYKHGLKVLACFNNVPNFDSKSSFDKFFNPSTLNKFLTESEIAKIEKAKAEGIKENYSFFLFESLVIRYLKSIK